MKGLIRNNFYSVGNSLPLLIVGELVFTILGLLFLSLKEPNSEFLATTIGGGLMGSQLGGFAGMCGTFIQKNALSKWSKFEITLPISRTTIMQARYITFLLYILIGIIASILTAIALFVLDLPITTERMGYMFSFGLVFGLTIPSLISPLTLIFGEDKNEVLLMISIIAGIVLFFGSSMIMTFFYPNISNLEFRTGILAFAIIGFILSYFLSLYLYKKKELV